MVYWTNNGTSLIKSWPNDLEDIGQGQKSLHATNFVMIVIIDAKHEKSTYATTDDTEWYFVAVIR